jgi:hypothetical protein
VPRLQRVDVSRDDEHVWVRYELTKPIPGHSDSAALAVTGRTGSGEILFGARFENGEKADLYYATATDVQHCALDTPGFVVMDGLIVTPFPRRLLEELGGRADLHAQLVINGLVVQGSFPVNQLD